VARFAVVGATSWGVTLAWLLARNGHHVSLLTRNAEEADAVRARRGVARLSAIQLPPTVAVLPSAAWPADATGIIVAVPAQAVRTTTSSIDFRRLPILSAAKGLELGTDLRMSEVLSSLALGSPISALSGPNLSHEIAVGMPTAAVVASTDEASASLWQRALGGGPFRVYTTPDIVGVELAGALKNVIAVAAGAAWGYGFGANAVATIMTRGLAEMTRLGVALGANPVTFQGLAGVGDLAATCFSPLSRNRRLGELLATGQSPQSALKTIGEAVEGATTARVAIDLAARAHISAPIAEQVAAVLAGERAVAVAMDELLRRPLGPEFFQHAR
jgi:glycerol-3-phosphate dehydrogenase (NAD(P)+)